MASRRYLLIILVAGSGAWLGCSAPPPPPPQEAHTPVIAQAAVAEVKPPGTAADFLSLFRDTLIAGLHIYSPCEKPAGKRYEGYRIGTEFYSFFEIDKQLLSELDQYTFLFSSYKVRLDSSRTGLIIRTPSQYAETAIDLFIWDNGAEKITGRVKLADGFADGMWFFVKDAWLADVDNDRQYEVVTRRKDWWQEDLPTTKENPMGVGPEHTSDSLKIFRLVGNKLTRSMIVVDAVKFNVLDWNKD